LAASTFRIQRWVCQQRLGQGRQPGFAGNLRLGAALWLVRQIQVFQQRFVVGVEDIVAQLWREFALLVNRFEDHLAPVFQLAQVTQTFFQIAQLRIVQPAGHFLAVTGDKRHGGAFVEQGDGGNNLSRASAEFEGDTMFNRSEHGCGTAAKKGVNYAQSLGKIQPRLIGVACKENYFIQRRNS
jgi:hypothetical protein